MKKVADKEIVVDDLPETSEDLISRCTAAAKVMNTLKKQIPSLKKPEVPAIVEQLAKSHEDHEAYLLDG